MKETAKINCKQGNISATRKKIMCACVWAVQHIKRTETTNRLIN